MGTSYAARSTLNECPGRAALLRGVSRDKEVVLGRRLCGPSQGHISLARWTSVRAEWHVPMALRDHVRTEADCQVRRAINGQGGKQAVAGRMVIPCDEPSAPIRRFANIQVSRDRWVGDVPWRRAARVFEAWVAIPRPGAEEADGEGWSLERCAVVSSKIWDGLPCGENRVPWKKSQLLSAWAAMWDVRWVTPGDHVALGSTVVTDEEPHAYDVGVDWALVL